MTKQVCSKNITQTPTRTTLIIIIIRQHKLKIKLRGVVINCRSYYYFYSFLFRRRCYRIIKTVVIHRAQYVIQNIDVISFQRARMRLVLCVYTQYTYYRCFRTTINFIYWTVFKITVKNISWISFVNISL